MLLAEVEALLVLLDLGYCHRGGVGGGVVLEELHCLDLVVVEADHEAFLVWARNEWSFLLLLCWDEWLSLVVELLVVRWAWFR